MGQGMRVTVDAAMRARDISRVRPGDEAAKPAPPAPTPAPAKPRKGEKRRLAKRRAARG